MRILRTRSTVGVAALVLALAACGGSETTEGEELDVGGVETTAPLVDAETEAQPDAGDDGGDGGDGGGDAAGATGDGGDDEVAAEGRPGPRKPFKVTYTGSSFEGESLTLVNDGDRFAIHLEGNGRIIQTPDETIFCEDAEGCFSIPSGSGMAESMTAGFGDLLTLEDAFEDGDGLPASWRIVGSRTIAGRSATCAEFDPDEVVPGSNPGSGTYCYDEDLGVGLAWEFTGDDGTREVFEATAVGTPTDADFEPTGPVQSLSDGS